MGLYAERVLPHVINLAMGHPRLRDVRARVCAGLAGDVVEIGFGTGHNLPYLPGTVSCLLAVEPAGRSVELARERIAAAPFPVRLVGLDGQRLALPDASADAVLCTWSLCTVPDPVTAVSEMVRVLKPGGSLRFVEHGQAPDPGVRRWQHGLGGIQRRIAGGCNLNRAIPAIIEAGGLHIEQLASYYLPGGPRPISYLYEGLAVPR